RGDLIEIFRGRYQHWAIYVGDGYVIHVVTASGHSNSGTSSVTTGKGGNVTVKKEKLQDVAGNDKYRISNRLDNSYEPYPIEDILKEAESLVGKEFPYNLLLNNCEHFATLVRNGIPHSQQVEEAKNFLTEQAKNFLMVTLMNRGSVLGIIVLATLLPPKDEKKEKVEEKGDGEL
uniref:LRAT domain-containing protein n=1 Tax=Cyprinus carpio carpio TaxID=630221 RepID=A0A9J7XDD8_CYPCA